MIKNLDEKLKLASERAFPITGLVSEEVIAKHRQSWLNAVKYLGPRWVGGPKC